ncbi:hypothetical protein JW879_08535 [candidate division WOR-3 bacterium]|nr:hypothetical protein [candidate division WOR-3 bacterium]
MKITKWYPILLTALIVSCASKEVARNNIKVHFKSLANDFAAVDMSLYDNNKFEIKTATLKMHGNEEYILELEGIWSREDSNYILTIEKLEKEELLEYFFGDQEYGESGFDIISENKVKFPIDREFLIINSVMCRRQ